MKTNKNEFEGMARKRLRVECTFSDNLVNILNNWLILKKTTALDEKRLDRIFKYCNGHLLIRQMINNGKDIFKFEKEGTYIINKILENIIISNQKQDILFNIVPLDHYRKYRIDRELYSPK